MSSERHKSRSRRRSRSVSSGSSFSSNSSDYSVDSQSRSRSRSSSRTPQRKVTVGPLLPPGFDRRHTDDKDHYPRRDLLDKDRDEDEDEEIGPLPAPQSLQDHEDGVSAATREFLEREQRQRLALEQANLAAEKSKTSRPDWMLVPPSLSSSLTALVGDPTQLKSRGFSQGPQRVQRRPGASGDNENQDLTLWTETPAERAQRLKEEVEGKRAKAGEAGAKLNSDDTFRADVQRTVDEQVERAIKERVPSRGTSLLEMHKEKRRQEIRDRERKEKRSRHRHHDLVSEKDDDGNDKEGGRSKRARHDRRHRSISPSASDKDTKSRRSSTRHDEKSKAHSQHRSTRHRDEKGKSSRDEETRRKRNRDRDEYKDVREKDRQTKSRTHRDEKTASDSDSEKRRQHYKEKDKGREKRRKEREERHVQQGKAKALTIWDRDAALSVGGRLIDEQSRDRKIKDASAISDRFASGSSRFL